MKQFLLDLTLFDNFYWKHWLFIFSIFIIIHIPAIYQASTKTNLAVHQAEAFLKGNTYVSNYYWDVAEYEGKYYVSFPPFPSIVALPFVALFEFVNSVLISLLLTCFSMYTLFQILVKILPDRRGRKWVFLSFFFGSGYWWTVLTSHHINGFAHVVCTLLLFLLLNELLNKQRPILIGLLIGAAFLSRQMTIFYGILILYYLVVNNSREKLFSSVIITGVTFAIPLGFYLYFNYLRFNSPFNTGHGYIVYQAVVNGNDLFKSRVSELGLFNWRYIPFNFYHLFIKGHNVIFGGQSMLKP
ncbi:MAG: glycosyltransferase 87 family protein, partial [Cyclobacteriaceae bacterium]